MAELFNHLDDDEASIVFQALTLMVGAIEAHREETGK
jgi:hypothetical protein